MMNERRSEERVPLRIQVRWGASSAQQTASISDISIDGCFIATSGRAALGEKIDLEIELPRGSWLALRGVVIHHQPQEGFGLRFTDTTYEERKAIAELIDSRLDPR
jgi:hypothetical protein